MIEIEGGGRYANASGRLAREVLGIDGKTVTYREFFISSGELLSSHRTCGLGVFKRWAARSCTPEEITLLSKTGPHETTPGEQLLAQRIKAAALLSLSDEELLDEIRRRGLPAAPE